MDKKTFLKNINLIHLVYVITIASIVILSFFIPKYMDYFFVAGCLKKLSIIKFMISQYFWLDGRTFSLAGLFQTLTIKYLPHTIIITIYSLFLISFTYFFSIFISNQLNIKKEKNIPILLTIIIMFFYGFYSHIHDTVYWAVGGAYVLHILLLILFLIFIEQSLKGKMTFSFIFYLSLWFLAGNISQNLFPALFIYAIYIVWKNKTEINKIKVLFHFSALFAGFAIIALAPGNFRRAISFEGKDISLNIMKLFVNYFNITLNYFHISIILIAFSIILGFIIFIQKRKDNDNDSSKISIIDIFKENIIWLIIALATILPMSIIPLQASPRTAIYFMVFISVFFVKISYHLFYKYLQNKTIVIPKTFSNLFIIIILAIHLIIISFQAKEGLIAINNQKANEKEILKQKNEGKNVVILKEIVTEKKAFTINYTTCPITKDPTFFANDQFATYYEIDSLIAE